MGEHAAARRAPRSSSRSSPTPSPRRHGSRPRDHSKWQLTLATLLTPPPPPPDPAKQACAARNATSDVARLCGLREPVAPPDDPQRNAGAPFTVIATTKRTTGRDAGFAHYGVGVEDSYFTLRESAHGGDARVTRPPLGVRPVTDTYAAPPRTAWVPWAGSRRCKRATAAHAAVYNAWAGFWTKAPRSDIPEALPWGIGIAVRERLPAYAVCGGLFIVGRGRCMPTTHGRGDRLLARAAARRADDRVGFFGTTYEQPDPFPPHSTGAPNASHNDADRRTTGRRPVWKSKFYRRSPESQRRPPRHRRDACSMAWRCRFAAQPSQDGRAIAEK